MDGLIDGLGSTAIAILGCLIVGAALKALDAGLFELGQVRLKAQVDGTGPYGKTAARALRDLDSIHARLLVGRVFSITAAAALAAHLVRGADSALAPLAAAAVVTVLYAVMAETAAIVARQRAGRWTLRLLKWMRPLELLLLPLAAPLAALGRLLERQVPEVPSDDPERVAELGFEQIIEEGEEEGAIPGDYAELLRSVLEFRNTVAHEVMVPRTQMVAIEMGTAPAAVVELIVEKGHSRYPVYRDRVDQVAGVLYAKDIFSVLRGGAELDELDIASLIREPVFFAAESQKIGALLREMQARRVHLAVVVDEFGGTSGIVTLEDIIEEIVGEIRDEYDGDEVSIMELGPGRYLVDAGISVYDLQDKLGIELRGKGGDYDSLGGMIVEIAGHVPTVGESVDAAGFELIVREADRRRVRRVELRQRSPEAAE